MIAEGQMFAFQRRCAFFCFEQRRKQALEKTLKFWNPPKPLAASLCFIQEQMYLCQRAQVDMCLYTRSTNAVPQRSRAEVQREFLGLKAVGWHPCLFYCSTWYLPIKFRASHIDLLVSSHSYLPSLVSVKTSLAQRFIAPFFFCQKRGSCFSSCFLSNWHVSTFLALFDANMAWQPQATDWDALFSSGRLLVGYVFTSGYKGFTSVFVCRALFHRSCQTPSGRPGRILTQSAEAWLSIHK